MATVHIVVLFAALVTLLGLRRAVCAARRDNDRQGGFRLPAGPPPARRLNEPAVRRSWSQRCEQDTPALRDLDCAMRTADVLRVAADLIPPPIEQIASDLRRLDRQRRAGPARGSQRWLAGLQRAYDTRLCLACRCLGVPEHLEALEGIDREIERVRVEHRLTAAGLTLRS